jgi:hypothetical protein
MLKKFISPLLALILAFGAVATASQDAEAHGRNVGVGIAAGIIGLGVLGAYAHARDREYYSSYGPARECYKGPEQCGWVNRRCFENSWGDTVCRGGRWTCWRDTICD